ncbi:uncharacterized protein EURHEDRAFT_416559 [Aspergillus ruber CBS 135680]|uniref:Uncharacterized protein n=1 Tax=Aspergillus ruber (strain CBS 135680) TaxID=1388766 RepID=A0A017S387_ASPRC|nr:uncharacterized protein EURHEDRAFT_416559 [Aspergillus ruber CBS 135680]EYE91311.1 hypothetical protein EURHEDRAFT_416559 [Aspergillus ruber CBS 135680]
MTGDDRKGLFLASWGFMAVLAGIIGAGTDSEGVMLSRKERQQQQPANEEIGKSNTYFASETTRESERRCEQTTIIVVP